MKCLSRWLFAAMAATVMCVGMWGCTDVDFHWYEHRSNAKVVGFIDDSLVIIVVGVKLRIGGMGSMLSLKDAERNVCALTITAFKRMDQNYVIPCLVNLQQECLA